MHLSRNCPFSDKTNLHLELPGFTIEKLTESAFLPGHSPGVPGTPSRPGGFQEFYDVIFLFRAFSAP